MLMGSFAIGYVPIQIPGYAQTGLQAVGETVILLPPSPQCVSM